MLGAIWLIFALDPKLKTAAEALIFQSGPKFLCFVVQFYKKFWFWCQTRIVPEKIYAKIWPVLEITSLKCLFPSLIDATYLSMWTIRFPTLPTSYIVYCVAFNHNQFLSCTLLSFANAVKSQYRKFWSVANCPP